MMKPLASLLALALATAPVPAAAADALAPAGRWTAYAKGAAKLPPMGWNSWNAFTSDIDEEKVLASAQVIVDSGLAAKGYRYIDIDDGWWLRRRQTDGRMVIRADRFPSAKLPNGETSFKPLTDRLHRMGLKAGIYSDIGRNSCGQVFTSTFPNQPEGSVAEREVGLYGHVDQDIRLYFADWGFDLIKVDGCGIRGLPSTDPKVRSGQYRAFEPLVDVDSLGRTDVAAVRALYEEVGRALERHNPDGDYIYSICIWGAANVRAWAKDVGNMSRTSEDISPTWSRMLHNLDSAARRPLYAHPGSWNDPDMLFVGSGEFDANHLIEARSHFSLWAMLNAPLIIGYDLRKATKAQMDILGAEKIIALNQDPAGNQAVLAFDSDDVSIFVKTLASGEKAVAILNRTSAPIEAILTAAQLKFLDKADIRLVDAWTGEAISFQGERKFSLAARETRVFTASGPRKLADGAYLSEQPGLVNPAEDGVTVPEAEPLIHRALLPWRGSRGSGEPPRYGGWGGAQPDRTPYGEDLAIGRKRFDTGIGVLANSRLEVRNNGAGRFTASVGIDDSARDRSQPVTFEVYGDGRLLTRTDPLRYGAAPVAISADVKGVRVVELVARTSPDVRFPDPVVWAEAALHR
ncbi:NPCBM/NEW2 domain-containing protein [Phenylobacterium deserti]|uniref:Alpha-galactosidase n=1 Tax=Phenylobacterium deserti TaxID=1914756 RepID=A0A328AD81_9CAUL|nr:NPCBM/NEW2 domain-containing protein [Phenylobacterium deserti]RAK52176.1 alpha-galactosidase [Phenylobacterium deserti]